MATTSTTSPQSDPPAARPSPFRSWWWLLLVPAVLGAALFFRPVNEEQKELETRRQQIEQMTAAERQRLKENFERFRQMPPEQQEALRQIAEMVEDDEDLQNTLYDYESWLGTLSPWERAELRKADTAEDRLAYVSTLIAAQQQEEVEEREWLRRVSEDATRYMMTFQWPGTRRSSRRRISEEAIPGMMAVLDAQYGSRVKLSKTVAHGCAAYHFQLLAEALKAGIEQNGLEQAREQPLPEQTMREMIEQLKDEEDRKLFDGWEAKWFVRWLTYRLERAWLGEANDNPPSVEELEKLARDIGGEFLSKYEETKSSEGSKDAYKRLLFATRPAYFYADTEDLNNVLVELKLREKRKKIDLHWPGWWGRGRGGDYRRDRGRDSDSGTDSGRDGERRRREIEPARAERPPRDRGE